MKIRKASTACAFIIATLCTSGCIVDKSAGVSGIIIDDTTSKPINNAKVSFVYESGKNEPTKTDSDGKFSIDKTKTYMFGLLINVHSNMNPYISGGFSNTLSIEAENYQRRELDVSIQFNKADALMSQENIDKAHRENTFPLGEIRLKHASAPLPNQSLE